MIYRCTSCQHEEPEGLPPAPREPSRCSNCGSNTFTQLHDTERPPPASRADVADLMGEPVAGDPYTHAGDSMALAGLLMAGERAKLLAGDIEVLCGRLRIRAPIELVVALRHCGEALTTVAKSEIRQREQQDAAAAAEGRS